jgi:hypothetical protein
MTRKQEVYFFNTVEGYFKIGIDLIKRSASIWWRSSSNGEIITRINEKLLILIVIPIRIRVISFQVLRTEIE